MGERGDWRLATPRARHRGGAGAAETGQDGDDRAAVGPLGAARTAAVSRRRDGNRRDQPEGGIEKLGDAKFELVVGDAGDSTKKARNAAQRLLSDQPDLIGGFGTWLSSFTLAVTE